MSSQRVLNLAVGQVPNLHSLIPRGRNDCGLKSVGAEANARDPVLVCLDVGDGELAFSESVPELDRAVTRSRDDLTVVDGESDGEDVFGVADEAAGGDAGLEVPEAELTVPGAGESELAVGGENHVFDEVGVAR